MPNLFDVQSDLSGILPAKTKAKARTSLTQRLLAVAAGFVVLAEAIVFLPTIAAFRHEWLIERFDTGELAVLAARAPVAEGFVRGDTRELMLAADVKAVSVLHNGQRQTLVGTAPQLPARIIDMETQTLVGGIVDVIATMFGPSDQLLAITARPRSNAAIKLEVLVSQASLHASLLRETRRVFFYSMLLALMIGLLVYGALAEGFVQPMKRLTSAIVRFRASPEDGSRNLTPSGRSDEIGEAEIAFADMQDTLRQSLLQRERLAQLGLSVSKIAHDLRHSLGAAQLVSERLSMVDDPVVRVTAPRLERALERAIGLAQSTLQFGKAQEAAPVPEFLYLSDALEEAASEALNGFHGVTWENKTDEGVDVEVDPDQLHRLLTNLIRNAGQAIVGTGKPGTITVQLAPGIDSVCLDITDTGPGLPRGVKENLFAPFAGSGLSGGTGLGLAIARDLGRMNGGEVALVSTGPQGTCFRVCLRAASGD